MESNQLYRTLWNLVISNDHNSSTQQNVWENHLFNNWTLTICLLGFMLLMSFMSLECGFLLWGVSEIGYPSLFLRHFFFFSLFTSNILTNPFSLSLFVPNSYLSCSVCCFCLSISIFSCDFYISIYLLIFSFPLLYLCYLFSFHLSISHTCLIFPLLLFFSLSLSHPFPSFRAMMLFDNHQPIFSCFFVVEIVWNAWHNTKAVQTLSFSLSLWLICFGSIITLRMQVGFSQSNNFTLSYLLAFWDCISNPLCVSSPAKSVQTFCLSDHRENID